MGVWGLLAFDRGQENELSFIINCQRSFTRWDDFRQCLTYGDELRPFNGLYLGLAYLLGFGNGSAISYQLLYGFLLWSKGLLVFRVVRHLCPTYPLFPFLAGAMAIAHVSDRAINRLGQMHQLGFIVTLLLAIDWFLISWQAQRRKTTGLFLGLSLLALYLSLWTYESHLLIILCVPVLLWVLQSRWSRQRWLMAASWYALPLIYIGLQVYRYGAAKTETYQTQIIRPSLDWVEMLADWGTHLQQSLSPWQWQRVAPNLSWPRVPGVILPSLEPIATTVACLVVLSCLVGIGLIGRAAWQLPPFRQLRLWLYLGLGWVLLSFPIYLLINKTTSFYRTQMLSSVGAAITLLVVIMGFSYLLPQSQWRPVVAIAASMVIIFTGVRVGVGLQLLYYNRWQSLRYIVAQVSAQVPAVKSNTMILITDIPVQGDPLQREGQKLHKVLQVLYAKLDGVAYYFYDTGRVPNWHSVRSPVWQFTPEGMLWLGAQPQPGDSLVAYSQMVVLGFQPNGSLALLKEFPLDILPPSIQVTGYAPEERIRPTLPDDRTLRLYAR